MPRYTSGGVRLHFNNQTPIGGIEGDSFDIGGITSINIPPGIETQGDDSGLKYEQSRSITAIAPVPSFTTKSLRQVLSLLGADGFCYGPDAAGEVGPQNTDGTHPGLEIYGRKQVDCQVDSSGDAKYTSGAGLLLLNGLSAERGQDVTLDVMSHCLSDVAGTAPLLHVYNATIPTTFVEEQFTLGHFMIAGIGINEEGMSVSVDFGVDITDKLPALGDVYPKSVGVRTVRPTITVTARDPSLIQAAKLALTGADCTHANTVFQFRKREDRATLIAAGTSEHVTMTAYGFVVPDEMFSGSGNADASNSFQIRCMDDGTNSPIEFNHSTTYDTDLTS